MSCARCGGDCDVVTAACLADVSPQGLGLRTARELAMGSREVRALAALRSLPAELAEREVRRLEAVAIVARHSTAHAADERTFAPAHPANLLAVEALKADPNVRVDEPAPGVVRVRPAVGVDGTVRR